ncbi:MAG: hypothetical protein HY879_13055 [Deltaproteobacteria bacterium]|nr:hypothetical protein [Deltaproteobacteria bacterium]
MPYLQENRGDAIQEGMYRVVEGSPVFFWGRERRINKDLSFVREPDGVKIYFLCNINEFLSVDFYLVPKASKEGDIFKVIEISIDIKVFQDIFYQKRRFSQAGVFENPVDDFINLQTGGFIRQFFFSHL